MVGMLDLISESDLTPSLDLDSETSLVHQLYPHFYLEENDLITYKVEEAKKAVSEYLGIPKNYLDLPIEIRPLPTEYKIIPFFPYGYLILEKKVLGEYDLQWDKISLDPIVLYDDSLLFRTMVHELIHRAQKVTGRIYWMDRADLEREAYSLTDEIISHYS